MLMARKNISSWLTVHRYHIGVKSCFGLLVIAEELDSQSRSSGYINGCRDGITTYFGNKRGAS